MPTLLATYSVLGTGSFAVGATTAADLTTDLRTAESGGTKVKRVVLSASADIRFSLGGTAAASTYHKLVSPNILEIDSDPWKFTYISVSGTANVYYDLLG